MARPAEKEWDHWVARIQNEGRGLTAWEETFMERVVQWREAGKKLSERQSELLEGIYAERTP